MKILIACFSRTGHTEKLMKMVGSELEQKGHTIEWEKIQNIDESSCLGLIKKDLHHYPTIFLGLFNINWRKYFDRTYTQIEENIMPLQHPDVSSFDRICIGGPKWARISYPIARYLNTVKGLSGKKIASVSTFGGPPLRVFEIEMIEKSMNRIINENGGSVISHLGVSSGFHELRVIALFRLISHVRFCRSLENFTIGSEYSRKLIHRFCESLDKS